MTNSTKTDGALPRYTTRTGWVMGDDRTLYAITDKRTGITIVRPAFQMGGVGPVVTVRLATKGEAEQLWQSPLHAGWKVAA